ncbi:MAG: hypothetical protein QOE68_1800 [Thermoanaerobaculia bacterium]|nr:hypothetical protein [Thermoanaerobaculia bacterium]
MISLLVAGFIFYLYAPHLLFKFAAATNYDLITRKEIPQVEEFFAAGLPGIFLNLQAVLLVRFVLPLFGIARITPDWQTIALIFEKEPDLSPYVRGPFITSLLAYAAMLGVSSSLAGWQYGRSLRLIALAGGTKKYVQQLFANVSIPQAVALPVRVLALWYSRFWNTFYAQYQDPFYPVVLRRSFAFVHTMRGLYHGIVFAAEKKRDGDIEGIVLITVSKFSRGHENELVRAGRNPITDLRGPLFIKWSEVTDINYPPDDGVLKAKRAEYQHRIDTTAKRTRRRRAFLRRLTATKKLSTAETVTTNG